MGAIFSRCTDSDNSTVNPTYKDVFDAFNFANLNNNPTTEYGEYLAFQDLSAFISLVTTEYDDDETKALFGWKFHVSIHDDDREKAWNLIFPILIEHKIRSAKVLKSGNSMNEQKPGREITIYANAHEQPAFKKELVEWQEIFQKIENKLIENNIRPNGLTKSDKQVAGSRYSSYRNDKGRGDEYIDADKANGDYNPGGHVDIYATMQLVQQDVHLQAQPKI